jgi:mRNA interferase MazF
VNFESENISTRVKVKPSFENGLKKTSYVMTEKIVTVEKSLLGKLVGCLSSKTMRLTAPAVSYLPPAINWPA